MPITTTKPNVDSRVSARESTYKTVTALVPAHNEAATIVDVIEGIKAQTYPIERILVVADNCTDNTAELSKRAGATVVKTQCGDKARAQNAVLHSIQTDYIVGWDGDTIPTPDCLELMMKDIEKYGHDATCSTVLPIQEKGFFIRARRFAYALGRRWWRLTQATIGRIQVLTGASYLFSTESIKAVGGFTTTEKVCSSDMPTTWLLHQAGYKCGYAGSAEALTYDPETLKVYWAQMQRWSSGYFQTIAWHKKQMLHPRSMLVVWTAIFDLMSLFWVQSLIVYMITRGDAKMMWVYAFWISLHQLITMTLVASVVGVKEAVLGVVPYTLVNFLNKVIYLNAFFREWVLGRHWSAWTGRQGRKTRIQPMTKARRRTLVTVFISAAATAIAWEFGNLISLTVTDVTAAMALGTLWFYWKNPRYRPAHLRSSRMTRVMPEAAFD